jgi:TetR/AcrR family transcriptional regulator
MPAVNTEEIERRSQILQAAFAEFSAKGFRGATIKSIARAAGLQSPSLIYWYFPTKEDLFQAVATEQFPLFHMAVDPAPLMELPPQQVLPMLARSYLTTLEQEPIRKVARLMLSEAVQRPEVAGMMGQRIIIRVLEFLKAYLARQVELGRLRPHDHRAAARAFIGMLIPQAIGMVFLEALRADGLTSEEHITTAVEIFLTGLKPAGD